MTTAQEFFESEHTRAWLRRARDLYPNIEDVLKYAVYHHFRYHGRSRWYYPVENFLNSYAQLRDLGRVECAWMDSWLDANILAGNDAFRLAAGSVTAPETILDTEQVQAWFRRVKPLDDRLCNALRFLVLRQSLGFGPPHGLVELIAEPFTTISKDLNTPCQALEVYLSIPRDDGMEVDTGPPAPPAPEPPLPDALDEQPTQRRPKRKRKAKDMAQKLGEQPPVRRAKREGFTSIQSQVFLLRWRRHLSERGTQCLPTSPVAPRPKPQLLGFTQYRGKAI